MASRRNDATGSQGRPPSSGYDEEERTYADWMHRFVERLAQHVPAQAFPRLLPIAAYWASNARHMDPEDAAQVAALWCCPESAEAGTASCEEAEAAPLAGEFDHLCALEQQICDATARIAAQERVVERLAATRHQTDEAEGLLDSMRAVLRVLSQSRSTVLLRWGRPPRGPIIQIRH